MSYRVALYAFTLSAFACTAAFAQARTPRSVQANTLGILEYCQAQGFSNAAAVQAQRKIMNSTVPGGPVEAAEATGRQGGVIGPDGTQNPLEAYSAMRHTTVAHTCQVYSQVAIRNAYRP